MRPVGMSVVLCRCRRRSSVQVVSGHWTLSETLTVVIGTGDHKMTKKAFRPAELQKVARVGGGGGCVRVLLLLRC